jgi:hypothetical protein
MTDTAIIGRNVEVLQSNVGVGGMSAFSWGAAVAGALAAVAVSFILISLGSGIGLLAASPYSAGPSLKTLTVVGAIWIVLAQTWGYAVGGYLAGRLRTQVAGSAPKEADFRDGAHGFVAWALGVLLTLIMVAVGSMFAIGLTGHVASTVGSGAASGMTQPDRAGVSADPTGYYVDSLFRTAPRGTPGATGIDRPATMPPQPLSQEDAQGRAEAGRIMATGIASGGLSEEDRAHLGRVVSARTGLPPEEANRRVQEVEARAKAAAKDTADKAAKAASALSFWTFMSLLMGAMAAVVGGIVGGNHRDEVLGLRAR